MARPVSVIETTPEERKELERRVRATTTAQRDCLRARIVLLRAEGHSLRAVATRLGVSVPTVGKWSKRFDVDGLGGLNDQPGRGAKRSISDSMVKRIIEMVAQARSDRQRWSTRTAAAAVAVSSDTVSRIWRKQGLKPQITRTFKDSSDRRFEEKLWDVIALYLDPPERALVLCCDEKAQCQGLERTQPCLPLGVGHIRTRTHDYTRHGTITLFAALNYLDGKLICRAEKENTHVEWLRFLKQIERETPKDLDLHLLADNCSTHQHAKVKAWLARRKRFHMHFVPTSSSWMNLVERFFADLTSDCVRAGSFKGVAQLVQAIAVYLAERNANPKPFRWKAGGKQLLAKIQRAREALRQQAAQMSPG